VYPGLDQGMQATAVFGWGEGKPVMAMGNTHGLMESHRVRSGCGASSAWRQLTLLTLPDSPVPIFIFDTEPLKLESALIMRTIKQNTETIQKKTSNQNIPISTIIIPSPITNVPYVVSFKTTSKSYY